MVRQLSTGLTFYVDEDLSQPLAASLRAAGHDAVHTLDVGNAGLIDPKQLAYAVQQGRVLVTANYRDFRMLHEAWLVWADLLSAAGSRPHAGILVVPNPNVMTVETMTRVIDEFARNREPRDVQGRLLRWRPQTPWEDLSAVR